MYAYTHARAYTLEDFLTTDRAGQVVAGEDAQQLGIAKTKRYQRVFARHQSQSFRYASEVDKESVLHQLGVLISVPMVSMYQSGRLQFEETFTDS